MGIPKRWKGNCVPLLLGLFFGAVHTVVAQGPFVLQVVSEDNVTTAASGTSLTVVADQLGETVTLSVRAVYRGNSTATVTSTPTLLGSGDFQVQSQQATPVTLSSSESFNFSVTYVARTSRQVSAQVSFIFSEAPPPNSPSTALPTTGFVSLTFIGAVPEFAVSYLIPADANFIPLAPGGRAIFPATPANTTSTIQVSILNRGSGPGTVRSISVTGENFQPIGISLLPLSINPGTELRFGVRFSPKEAGTFTGSAMIEMGESIQFPFDLEGTSTAPILIYEVVTEEAVTPVEPGGAFPIQDTAIGETSSVTFQIRNTGTGSTTLNPGSIALTGAGFQIADLAPLPQTLEPNTSLLFTINFTPTQPGPARGRLRIGSVNFDINAVAIGNRLSFSYISGTTPLNVSAGGTVLVNPTPIGETSEVRFQVKNTGTSNATVTRVTLTEPRNGFILADLPGFPLTLAPQGTSEFTIRFSPRTNDAVSATLLVDTQSFTLSGSGTEPPPLPSYSIEGPSGTVPALTQPAIRLALAAPYPVAINGVLTLDQVPLGFFGDPSVQFSNGGRTAAFTISANSTQAVFGNGSDMIRIQTGSVAGEIVLTPTFTTQSGFNLTPASGASLRMTVAPSSPQLVSVEVSQRGPTTLVLLVTGVTTTRSLTRLNFRFNGISGASISGGEIASDITSLASSWFNTQSSQQFGGQFTATVNFGLQNSAGGNATDFIQSVDVTASNSEGTSSALTVRVN
jgi:hypothetical protein